MPEAMVQEERIDSTKGIKIFVRSWRPESRPRAAVVICHGVSSHGGQYSWAGEQLSAAGFSAFALDLRVAAIRRASGSMSRTSRTRSATSLEPWRLRNRGTRASRCSSWGTARAA